MNLEDSAAQRIRKSSNRQQPLVVVGKEPNKHKISSIILGIYVFSVIVISSSAELNLLSRMAGIAALGTFAADFVIARKRKLIFPGELKPLCLFFILMVASGLWAMDFSVWFTRTSTYLQLLIFAIAAINILNSRKSIKPITVGILSGLSWAVLVAIRDNNFDLFTPHNYRAGSILVNPNAYVVALMLGILISLYASQAKSGYRVIWIMFIIVFAHQIIFYAGSRKGLISLIMFGPIFIFFRYIVLGRIAPVQLVVSALAIIVLYFCAIWLLEQTPYYYRLSRIEFDLEEGTRGKMIEFGLEKWQEKPILGYGANQYRALFAQSGFGFSYAHNNYIELLVNNGVLGLTIYYSFYFSLARNAWLKFRSLQLSKAETTWIFLCLIVLLFFDFGLVSYYNKSTWILFILIITILNKRA